MTVTQVAAPVPQAAGPAITVAGRSYPVLLPRLRDPRLHVAAVVVSVQVLGQTVLDFDVSIAQILIAIATAAVLELTIVAATAQVLAWPASALLTGNGVALILRTPGTEHGDWWSTNGWPIFVAAAGVGLLSKYAIRVGDRPLFNPSNLGLVLVFLVFGARYADPQDLWWGPWRPGLALTFAVIIVGGITLSMRLRLFSVAATFWLTFAAAIGVLAAQGHAITARWHLGPVEGWSYWWVFVFSPEVVIFVFFMITDPRTAPVTRVARPVYAASVGLLAGVLAAMQRTEFATKVSLLLALTLVCAARPLLERWLPDERRVGRRDLAFATTALLVGLGAVAVVGSVSEGPTVPAAGAVDARDPASALPEVTISPHLDSVAGGVSPAEAERVGRDLLANLETEAEALAAADAELAGQVAFGLHLAELEAAIADGPSEAEVPEIDRMEIVLLRDPVSPQAIPQLGVLTSGSDPRVYLVTSLGGRYLTGQVLPPDTPMLVGG